MLLKSIKNSPLLSLVFFLVLPGPVVMAEQENIVPANVEKKTDWAFYMDNDLFITPSIDRDYTAGLSIVFSGDSAAKHPLSMDAIVGGFDSLSGINAGEDLRFHSYEFGITGFTPNNIFTSFPVQDDRPYASLVYVANSRQYVRTDNKSSLISTFSLGVLGLDIAGNLQNSVHKVINLDEAKGWHNQISNGGELTFLYSVSGQRVRWSNYTDDKSYEIKTAVKGSIGYLTDLTLSLSGRWGRIRSPWWTFNPQTSEYTEKSAPALATLKSLQKNELYFWSGVSVHLRAYNVFLQGQTKDSVVTFDSDELNHAILDMWLGVTAEILHGIRISYSVRGQTSEIKQGAGNRHHFWGGIILSVEI